MQALVYDGFGGPERMGLREIARPRPQEGEVLIRILCDGVNPVDWKVREGMLAAMFEHRFPLTPGWDCSGVIAGVGAGVPQERIGQFVFGYCRQYGTPAEHGTCAQYIAAPAALAVAAPARLSPAQAAAIPTAGLSAWQGLLEAGQLRKGQSVLILGGAGGVGTMAIQLARLHGARVLATASAANHGLVKALGAHAAIDYRSDDLEAAIARLAPGGVDLVLDCVGGPYLQQGLRLARRARHGPGRRAGRARAAHRGLRQSGPIAGPGAPARERTAGGAAGGAVFPGRGGPGPCAQQARPCARQAGPERGAACA